MAIRILIFLFLFSSPYFGTVAQVWTSVGNGISNSIPLFTPSVRAISIYNTELYAGGSFDNADGLLMNNISNWNGTNISREKK